MTAATTIRYQAGTVLRCPQPRCGATIVATGLELTAICDGGGRHRATRMTECADAASEDTTRPRH